MRSTLSFRPAISRHGLNARFIVPAFMECLENPRACEVPRHPPSIVRRRSRGSLPRLHLVRATATYRSGYTRTISVQPSVGGPAPTPHIGQLNSATCAMTLPFGAARKPKPMRAFQPAEHQRESDDRDNTETDKDRRENCGSEIQTETDPAGKGERQEVQGAARREYRLSLRALSTTSGRHRPLWASLQHCQPPSTVCGVMISLA
jgi:hypothetical protein